MKPNICWLWVLSDHKLNRSNHNRPLTVCCLFFPTESGGYTDSIQDEHTATHAVNFNKKNGAINTFYCRLITCSPFWECVGVWKSVSGLSLHDGALTSALLLLGRLSCMLVGPLAELGMSLNICTKTTNDSVCERQETIQTFTKQTLQ